MAFNYENFCTGNNFDVDIITDTFCNDRSLFERGWQGWLPNILRLFITRLLYYTPWYKVNMAASESSTTSPPALAGSSFSIENLLNLSEGATEKTPTATLSPVSSTCDFLRMPSFPLVPKVVRPFTYHGHSLPLCTPEPGFNFGGIPHPRSESSIYHFPIANNGPPSLGKLKRGVHWVNTSLVLVLVARKVRLVISSFHFILHRVNGWKLSHILSHKLIVLFVNGLRWDVHTTFVYLVFFSWVKYYHSLQVFPW